MIISSLLSGLAILLWLGLAAYIVYVMIGRARGRPKKISITATLVILLGALIASALSTSIVVIDAGEVGVVFNAFTGTQEASLYPGMHVILPYINTVYRYSTRERVYTMTTNPAQGEADTLWSPTLEGLQVGVDSSTRYAIDPRKAAYVHNNFRHTYEEVLIRPSIRSIVRHYISQNYVTDVYGPKRRQIQMEIEKDIRERFEGEGFLLLSFDVRNINFTDEYARAIEQKQVAQQEAERMQFVLQREQREAERKKIAAEGDKQAAITKAEGEAEALRLVSEALRRNPDLLTYRYIEKLAPNVQVMMLPSGAPFILSLEQLKGQMQGGGEATQPEIGEQGTTE